ncbi:MAG: hypothetical protein LBN39_05905, partial [Planctomycetaceae bacterium]|nr:hypothetical protein [Planctomycetaceae bacterium]
MSETQDTKPQSNPPVLAAYTISWRWLFGGLLVLLLGGSAVGGLYYVRSIGMASHVLSIVQRMNDESKTLKENGKITESIQERRNAANLLKTYNVNHQGIFEIQKELNTVLESLYTDSGAADKALLCKELMDNCNQLIATLSSDKESLPYKIRLMELEWDIAPRSPEVLERAKEVMRVERTVNDRDNYDAMRMITRAVLRRLETSRYNPAEFGSGFPEHLDQLLEKVYNAKRDDIEIASLYAAFIIDTNDPLVRQNASEKLLATPEADRRQTAVSIIDNMVSMNQTKPEAYLTRFRFRAKYTPSPVLPDDIDPDLKAVLNIEPGNTETLILAGMYAIQQSELAQQNGDKAKAEERRKTGEEYLRQSIKDNPLNGLGYQYLGDYLSVSNRLTEAIEIWEKGIEEGHHPAVEELIGRFVMGAIELKLYPEAEKAVSVMSQVVMDARLRRPAAVAQIRNMATLLTAQLLAAEGTS